MFDLGTPSIIDIVLTIIISLSIHEAMHAFTAHWLGDTTAEDMGRLSLNPLKHIDPLTTVALPIISLIIFKVPILAAKPVPFNPDRVKYDEFGAALVGAAGPLTNLALALIGDGLLHVVSGAALVNFLVTFVELNVLIAIFNLIPIPPMDGSRVLYAFAPESVQNFMRQIEPFGLFIVFGLVLTGILLPLLSFIDNSILNLLP